MDSRTALRGSSVSRQVVAVALVVAVILLGVVSAIVVRSLTAPAAAGSAGYGSVTFAAGPAFDDTNRHHGTQSIGGSDAKPAPYREPSSQRGGPQG